MRRHRRYPRYRASARQAPQLAIRWLALALITGMVLFFPDWLGAQGLRSNVAAVRLTVVKPANPVEEPRRAVDTQVSIPESSASDRLHLANGSAAGALPLYVRDKQGRLQPLLKEWVEVAPGASVWVRALRGQAGMSPESPRVSYRITRADGTVSTGTVAVSFLP